MQNWITPKYTVSGDLKSEYTIIGDTKFNHPYVKKSQHFIWEYHQY